MVFLSADFAKKIFMSNENIIGIFHFTNWAAYGTPSDNFGFGRLAGKRTPGGTMFSQLFIRFSLPRIFFVLRTKLTRTKIGTLREWQLLLTRFGALVELRIVFSLAQRFCFCLYSICILLSFISLK